MKNAIQQLENKNLLNAETVKQFNQWQQTKSNIDAIVLQILSDSIIFEKINIGVRTIQGAFEGGAGDFNVEYRYYGIGSAMDLLGCYDEETREILRMDFYTTISDTIHNEEDITAPELAKVIFDKWKKEITKN